MPYIRLAFGSHSVPLGERPVYCDTPARTTPAATRSPSA